MCVNNEKNKKLFQPRVRDEKVFYNERMGRTFKHALVLECIHTIPQHFIRYA